MKLTNVMQAKLIGKGWPKMLDPQTLQAKAETLTVFSGGPLDKFAKIGKFSFDALVSVGMAPDHNVLDIGCGCLRVGTWVIDYLAPGRYWGVEPNAAMLNEGKSIIAGQDLIEEKRPNFANNASFDFSFDATESPVFDMVLARSIFTHTSKAQMKACLENVSKQMKPGGFFLLSFIPPKLFGSEYSGDTWIGKSHESNEGGLAFFRKRTIVDLARPFGFEDAKAASFGLVNNQQKWLLLRRI